MNVNVKAGLITAVIFGVISLFVIFPDIGAMVMLGIATIVLVLIVFAIVKDAISNEEEY